MTTRTWALAIGLVLAAGPTSAQPTDDDEDDQDAGPPLPALFQLPWSDVAPSLGDEGLEAAAVGLPDERIQRLAPRRDSARRRGRERALSMLHRFVDEALADRQASPRDAQRVHDAVDRLAEVRAVRALVDGSAVVVMSVARAELWAAAPLEGLPWAS